VSGRRPGRRGSHPGARACGCPGWERSTVPERAARRGDLSRCRSHLFPDPGKQIDDYPLATRRLRRIAGQAAADIHTGEGRVSVDLSGEITPAQRADGHEADPELLACRQYIPPQRSSTTASIRSDCRDRLDGVGATDVLRRLPKGRSASPCLLNQVLYRSATSSDGHARIHTVLIEQIDGIHLEPLERGLGEPADVLSDYPAHRRMRSRSASCLNPNFRGDYHSSAGKEKALHPGALRW